MNSTKITIEQVRALDLVNGGKCLSEEYFNSKSSLTWECKKGHRWITTYNSIRQDHWCPYCKKVAKRSLEEYQDLAQKKEGHCISEEYINSNTPLEWQCKKGHTWKALGYHIKQGGWCPFCNNVGKGTIEEYRALAKKKGGKCLSRKYKNCKTKLEWECDKGHSWEATPSAIKHSKRWCPYCKKNDNKKIVMN